MSWPSDEYGAFPLGSLTHPSPSGARVKLSAGALALAAADEHDIGTVDGLSGAMVKVRYRNAPGPQRMLAAEAFSIGDEVFAAAAGKVAKTGALRIGIATTAAAGDGSEFQVLRGSDLVVTP